MYTKGFNVHDALRGQAREELSQHKERVTDALQGLVTTIDKLPSVLLAESAPQISAATKALLSREAGVHKTKEILAQLPADLSAYDSLVDELQQRATDLQRAVHVLGGGSGGGGGAGAGGGQPGQPGLAAATSGAPAPLQQDQQQPQPAAAGGGPSSQQA
ncbi:hypothetical protein Rsub_00838 [Raphidocelis subcapitata]|uniref:Uncharacterized protein n=1 Tax=Raphidocelis subcapitata TaxID=307507 RepID=A0A2V0NL61_9CHLO|nr:hypothetical protein Rsub_00838 [Raphidocelis subcapitata]|eukprot:GBF88126.1 hypothetical protein Rsub_00838 [Raphidocelis subcapitata]